MYVKKTGLAPAYRVGRANLYTFYIFESAEVLFENIENLLYYKSKIHFLATWSPNFSTEKFTICCWEHFPWNMSNASKIGLNKDLSTKNVLKRFY